MWVFKYIPSTFVFCYHRVIPIEIARYQLVHKALFVTPSTFEQHIKWMQSVGDIVNEDCIFESSRYPKFMVTFDDGWRDNYEYAFPILSKYSAPAVIFIATDNINSRKLFWSEEIGIALKECRKSGHEISVTLKDLVSRAMGLASDRDRVSINSNWSPRKPAQVLDRFIEFLKVLPVDAREEFLALLYSRLEVSGHTVEDLLLSWKEIGLMKGQEISFGSHTHTHPILDRMNQTSIDNEVYTSKQLLERQLGEPIRSFSYPNGCFRNPHIQSSLRTHGYKYGFTLERSPVLDNTDPYLIPRCLVYETIAANLERYFSKLVMRSSLKLSLNRVKGLWCG